MRYILGNRNSYSILFVLILALCSCNKSSKVSGDAGTENDSGDTAVQNSDESETADDSAPDTTLDSEDDSQSDSDSETGDVTFFDTDPTGECVHPRVTEKCSDGWCEIPPGCYIYGSPEDQPCRGALTETQVQVTLTRGFMMQQTEVTQAQWEEMGFENPVESGAFRDYVAPNKPVTYVNWYEAMAYANALSEKEGLAECYNLANCTGVIGSGCESKREFCGVKLWDQVYNCDYDPHVYEDWYACPGYRLPTAAEWEYAARAGTTTATYNGDFKVSKDFSDFKVEPVLEPIAWYQAADTGEYYPIQESGLKRPNNWGLYDILGNVDEWIDYIFTGFSLAQNQGEEDPLVDPVGTKEETNYRRTRRGGKSSQIACRCAVTTNGENTASDRTMNGGFRLVRTLSASDK